VTTEQNDASPADDWLRRLRGDPPTRENAIGQLHRLLVRGLTRSLGDRYGGGVQAEDIAQAAVLKILDSLDTFEGKSRFTTWAMTVATRLAISELRRKRFQDVSLDHLLADPALQFQPEQIADQSVSRPMEQRLVLQRLRELIDTKLTDKQRRAMQLTLEGVPVEEIARKSGSNRNAIYKRIHDARVRLREGMEAHGFSADDLADLFP